MANITTMFVMLLSHYCKPRDPTYNYMTVSFLAFSGYRPGRGVYSTYLIIIYYLLASVFSTNKMLI